MAKSHFWFILIFLFAANVQKIANAQNKAVDISAAIDDYNKFFSEFRSLLQILKNPSFRDSLSQWTAQGRLQGSGSGHQQYINGMHETYKSIIRSPMLLNAFSYFIKTNQTDQAKKSIKLYYTQLYLFLKEMSQDPRFPNQIQLSTKLNEYKKQLDQVDSLLQPLSSVNLDNIINWDPSLSQLASRLQKAGGLFTLDPKEFKNGIFSKKAEIFPNYPGPWRPLSYSGFIPGNQVRHVQDTAYEKTGASYLQYISDRLHLVPQLGYSEDRTLKKLSHYKAALRSKQNPFSHPDLESIEEHPAFQESSPNIFYEVRRSIASANHTIFVDIFFLGGSVGVAIAQELIRKAESGVKVFIIRDYINHFGGIKEMLPVMQYLRAYSELNPGKLMIVPPVLDLLPSGLPTFLDKGIQESRLKQLAEILPSEIIKSVNGYVDVNPSGKADHSKVLLVDACQPGLNTRALIASKNWTDASGAVTKDDGVMINGPASCVIQNHYLHDMQIALLNDSYATHIDGSAMPTKGYINFHYGPQKSQFSCSESNYECKVMAILSSFNPMTNKGSGHPPNLNFPALGDATIRFGENNADGTIRSALDQITQLILNAKHQVLIRSLYLFSRPIANAIITAVRNNPNLKVYIITDGYENKSPRTGMEGFPNWLYLDQLYALNEPGKIRVQVRFFKADYIHPNLNQEFHYKSYSADGFSFNGQALSNLGTTIIGSANLDPLTMLGSFREAQTEIYSANFQKDFDGSFWAQWNSAQTFDALPWNFTLPGELAKVDKGLFINALRQISEPLYDIEFINSLL